MKRFLYLALYVLFALGGPLLAVDYQFELISFGEWTTEFKVGFGGFIFMVIIFTFFAKNLVAWAKSFDRITWFKGFLKWAIFVFPAVFGALFALATYKFGEVVLPIMTVTAVTHMIAGIFLVLYEKEKVERFKKWVNN